MSDNQVKEKLGMLRYCIRDLPVAHRRAVGTAIAHAEDASAKTCE